MQQSAERNLSVVSTNYDIQVASVVHEGRGTGDNRSRSGARQRSTYPGNFPHHTDWFDCYLFSESMGNSTMTPMAHIYKIYYTFSTCFSNPSTKSLRWPPPMFNFCVFDDSEATDINVILLTGPIAGSAQFLSVCSSTWYYMGCAVEFLVILTCLLIEVLQVLLVQVGVVNSIQCLSKAYK